MTEKTAEKTVCAWFSGFLTLAVLLDAKWLAESIWNHYRDGMAFSGFLLVIFLGFWMATLLGLSE